MATSPMVLEDQLDGTWILRADLTHEGPAGTFFVPKGFRTDLASVPRLLWNIVPPFGRHGPAAVFHDCAYRLRPDIIYQVGGSQSRTPMSRAQADAIFRHVMVDCGVPKWRAWLMWAAVRLFGRSAWNQPRMIL